MKSPLRLGLFAVLPLLALAGCNDTPAQSGGSGGGGGGGGSSHSKSHGQASKERLAKAQHHDQKAHK